MDCIFLFFVIPTYPSINGSRYNISLILYFVLLWPILLLPLLEKKFIVQYFLSNLTIDLVCPIKYPKLEIDPNDSSRGYVCRNLTLGLNCPIKCSDDVIGDYICVQNGTNDVPCRITGELLTLFFSNFLSV